MCSARLDRLKRRRAPCAVAAQVLCGAGAVQRLLALGELAAALFGQGARRARPRARRSSRPPSSPRSRLRRSARLDHWKRRGRPAPLPFRFSAAGGGHRRRSAPPCPGRAGGGAVWTGRGRARPGHAVHRDWPSSPEPLARRCALTIGSGGGAPAVALHVLRWHPFGHRRRSAPPCPGRAPGAATPPRRAATGSISELGQVSAVGGLDRESHQRAPPRWTMKGGVPSPAAAAVRSPPPFSACLPWESWRRRCMEKARPRWASATPLIATPSSPGALLPPLGARRLGGRRASRPPQLREHEAQPLGTRCAPARARAPKPTGRRRAPCAATSPRRGRHGQHLGARPGHHCRRSGLRAISFSAGSTVVDDEGRALRLHVVVVAEEAHVVTGLARWHESSSAMTLSTDCSPKSGAPTGTRSWRQTSRARVFDGRVPAGPDDVRDLLAEPLGRHRWQVGEGLPTALGGPIGFNVHVNLSLRGGEGEAPEAWNRATSPHQATAPSILSTVSNSNLISFQVSNATASSGLWRPPRSRSLYPRARHRGPGSVPPRRPRPPPGWRGRRERCPTGARASRRRTAGRSRRRRSPPVRACARRGCLRRQRA